VDDTTELAAALTSYLAGQDAFDEDLDMDATELREWVLGDIFHSNPSVVGPPSVFLAGEAGYGSTSTSNLPFRKQWAERDRVIYAGANDGMLHAFHAGDWFDGDDPNTAEVENGYYDLGTGVELFGYVPGLLLDEVKYIPRNVNHTHYFVDGSPTVADAWLGDPNDPNDVTKTPDEWATMLVVGFREGGAGYLALDVTNPDATSWSDPHGPYPKFMWEFTHANLGEAWSEPVITRVKVAGATGLGDKCGKNNGDGDCREQWVAIFGAGYDETGNPNSASYDSAATISRGIFMVALDTGALLSAVLYDPNATDGREYMDYSLPSMPAVLDLNFDGFADVVYIGDLGGQMWKWDISAVGSDSNSDSLLDNWTYGRFFSAGSATVSGVPHYRSIYFPAAASFVGGDLVLAFGTGERDDLFYAGSATDDENNRFYVVRDDEPTGSNAFSAGTYTESNISNITGADSDSVTSDQGFYFKLEDSEKFVTNQLVFAGFVIAATYVPDDGSTDSCDRAGEARLYVFDVESGLGYYFEAGVTTGDGARYATVGSGAPTDPRLSISMTGEQLYIQTSTGQVVQVDPPDPGSLARTIYWRHLY
jgi:type IV pilus assembly protein PilY1